MSFVICHLSFVICHFASPPASALEGTVTLWSSDETVAGATVTVAAEDQPVTRTTTTDSSGRFRFPLLPAGRYSVTAASTGYSTVTLVNVVVVPGDERRVRLEVTRTDEKESVTETVNATLQTRGVDGGWVVPVSESDALPLLHGTVEEVAALLPVASVEQAPPGHGGLLLLEAAGPASVSATTASAAAGAADENRLVVVPRWGAGRMQGTVRFVHGESVDDEDLRDDWSRGSLTLGGSNDNGGLSGFLSIEHAGQDGDLATQRRTAITATAALATSAAQSIFLVANGSVSGVDPAVVYPGELDRSHWSIRASHAFQVSARAANHFDLSVEDRTDDLASQGAADALRSVSVRERAIVLAERFAFLPGTRLRHELRGGVTARLGIDDRLTLDDAMSGRKTFREGHDEAGVWLEDELMLDRLVLRGGLRVDRLEGSDDTTELAPRIAIAWQASGDDPLVLRGSWGRFHESVGLLDALGGSEAIGLLPDNVDAEVLGSIRTDRAVVGVSRDLSGLAAFSLDVVSSRSVHVPFVRDGSIRLGEVELLEATLGGRLDVFGKADALLSYTWTDTETEVPREERPEHRASLALRASLPATWTVSAIVRHKSCLRTSIPGAEMTDSSTTLDLSLSKAFAAARLAVEAFNVTDEKLSLRSDRPPRSIAVHLSYRFGE